MGRREALSLRAFTIIMALVLCLGWPNETAAYAVLAHEAIIDSAWDTNIRLLLLKRFPDATKKNSRKHTAMSFPGRLRLRPEGPIFFANAAQIAHKIGPLVRETRPTVVAVGASGVLDMEYTALKMFAQVVEKQSQDGIQLWLIGINSVRLEVEQNQLVGVFE